VLGGAGQRPAGDKWEDPPWGPRPQRGNAEGSSAQAAHTIIESGPTNGVRSVARVGRAEVRTQIGGRLRGPLRPGLRVSEGLKAGDEDSAETGRCASRSRRRPGPWEAARWRRS